MSNKILVTDSLFIFDEHVKKLEAAGFEVERLDKSKATEAEMVAAIKGKVGYILGGTEKVTKPVIEAADSLKTIVFTGTGYKGWIPAWKFAMEKGVLIANAPYANAPAVAEWLVAVVLAMTRNLFVLGRTGDKTFQTTPGLSELKVGIVGLGHVGLEAAKKFEGLGVQEIAYWSREQKDSKHEYLSLEVLLKTCDVVCVCVADEAGQNFLNADSFAGMKPGSLLASITHPGIIDEAALLKVLESNRVRAALDYTPKTKGFEKLSLEAFYCSNESAAYNTKSAAQATSDMATQSMIHILTTGDDEYVVNKV